MRKHCFVLNNSLYHTILQIFIGRGKIPTGTTGLINVEVTATTAVERECLINDPPYTWLDVQTTAVDEFTINFDQSGYAPLTIPTDFELAEKINVQVCHLHIVLRLL